MSVNRVILIGNLGKDPEIKTLESNTQVANFSVATTESYKDKNGEWVNNTEWINIVFFGPVVKFIEKSLKKGSQVYIEGKIKTRSWEDKDGNKKYSTEVIGSEIRSLDKKAKDENPKYEAPVDNGEEEDLPF